MEYTPPARDPIPITESSTSSVRESANFLAVYGLDETMLRNIKDILIDIARDAGRMMAAADPLVNTSEMKNNSSDRVTATDKAVEKMVHDRLTARYPDFGFLAEESFVHGDKLTDIPTFICDPIDGTLNFIHGFPNIAVSLALAIEKKPFIGVVYNPFSGHLFTAIKGQGAFLTRASGTTCPLIAPPVPKPMSSLNDCLVAIEWGNQRSGSNWELRTSIHRQIMTAKAEGGAMVHSVRSLGSAALDFCYVAAGWIDLFWEGSVWVWDVAAGWCILEEAGGIVASANPGNWNPSIEGRGYLAVRAAKRAEQHAVVEELWGLMGDRKFEY